MDLTVTVHAYEPGEGLRLIWDDDAWIEVTLENETVRLVANPSGLATIARHLLTLAQSGVPAGTHVHLDRYSGLEISSAHLVLERSEDA